MMDSKMGVKPIISVTLYHNPFCMISPKHKLVSSSKIRMEGYKCNKFFSYQNKQ
jgi:hypothetical protein